MKNKIEEIIRVDHAGERGAIKIYDGQLLALQLLKSDPDLEKKVSEMKEHEKEHLKYFEEQLADRKIRPTLMLPLWDLLGTALGFGTAILGKKAAMLCTASVEEVIDKHYLDQINYLSKNEKKEKDLLSKVKKFRQDELEHRDIAYEEGADKNGPYGILDAIIKIGSKAAIEISKKI
jgi:ubiquinone biosynthesis monooxygenase Coq7